MRAKGRTKVHEGRHLYVCLPCHDRGYITIPPKPRKPKATKPAYPEAYSPLDSPKISLIRQFRNEHNSLLKDALDYLKAANWNYHKASERYKHEQPDGAHQ